MVVDQVEDAEALYRCVPSGRGLYEVLADGSTRFNSTAFLDRAWRPSVDRAEKCGNNPSHTQFEQSDGIVSLVAHEVRNVTIPRIQKGVTAEFKADVEPKPLQNNLAHAEIYMHPQCPNQSTFRKLTERLALIASSSSWEILPFDLR